MIDDPLVTLASSLKGRYLVRDEERFSYLIDLVCSFRGSVLRQLYIVLEKEGEYEVLGSADCLALEWVRSIVIEDFHSSAGVSRAATNILDCACLAVSMAFLQADISGRLTANLGMDFLQGERGQRLIWEDVVVPMVTRDIVRPRLDRG